MEMSVSIVAARWRAFSSAARWKPKPAQKTTGVASASASHSQPSNWSGGIIASSDERRGQRGGDDQPACGARRCDRPARPPRPRALALVAGRLDRADEVGDGRRGRVEADRRLLGRVVDRRLDAVELVELALDAVRARGAGHALEGEVDRGRARALRDGAHAASYPASTIAAAQRGVVELAAADGHDLRVEIDGDVLDAVDLGHLLADRHRAVRRSGSRERCT